MSGPIPFIQPDDDGVFHVDKRAAKILSAIKGPVSVVCVAGPYRTGKSYLLNRLIFNENAQSQQSDQQPTPVGFQVGNSINACTKGIWLWSEPYYNSTTNTTYLFLDTEGLNSTGEEATFDTQIFSLSVLLSSVFILNTQNSITESELEQLELVAECSKKISFEGPGGGGSGSKSSKDDDNDDDDSVDQQLALHFPRLIWVLRDFALELVDKEGNKISPNQYLEKTLSPLPTGKKLVAEKNRIRKCIRDCFLKRECVPLPRPVTDEKQLQQLQKVPVGQLRPEFQQGIRNLKMRSLLLHTHFREPFQLPPNINNNTTDTRKYINNKPITGDVLCGLAEMYVDAINSGQVPTILSAWQSVLETKKLAMSQEYCTDIEAFLWSLVDPVNNPYHLSSSHHHQQQQQQQRRGSIKGGNADQGAGSPLPEPEYDTEIITQRYHDKLKSFSKQLQSHFPGDIDSITLVQQTILAKTEPVLHKVCGVATMHAKEYNKKLFQSILSQINPQYKVQNDAVFGLLTQWDPQTADQPPVNNASRTFTHITTLLELFQKKAKGSDRGASVERELLLELANKANQAQFGSIVQIGGAHLDLKQRQQQLKLELEQYKKDIAATRAQAEKYNSQVNDLNGKLNTLREEKAQIVTQLKEEKLAIQTQLSSEKLTLQTQLELLTNKHSLSTEQLSTVTREKKQLQHDHETLKQQLHNTTQSQTATDHKLVQVNTEFKSLTIRTAELDALIAKREGELKTATKSVQQSHERIREYEQNTANLEQMVTSLNNAQKSQRAENVQLEEELQNYKNRFASAQKTLAEHGDANAMVRSMQHEVTKVQNKYENEQRENQVLQDKNTFLTQKVSQLQQDVVSLEKQHAELHQAAILEATKRKSFEMGFSQQQQQQFGGNSKKQRFSVQSDDGYDAFSDAIDYSNFDHGNTPDDDQYHSVIPTKKSGGGKLVQLPPATKAKGDRTATPMEKKSPKPAYNSSDDEMDQVAQNEARRRSTFSQMVRHDANGDDSDDDHHTAPKQKQHGAQTGWSNPLTFSPAKIPDQAKIMERRKRDGSIFAKDEDESDVEQQPLPTTTSKKVTKKSVKKPVVESDDGEDDDAIAPVPKRGGKTTTVAKGKTPSIEKQAAKGAKTKHSGPTSDFKAAAKASYLHDEEAEYTRLKAEMANKAQHQMGDSEDDDEYELPGLQPDVEPPSPPQKGSKPPKGAPALPKNIATLSVAALRSWLDCYNVPYMGKAGKADLIILVKAYDPRY